MTFRRRKLLGGGVLAAAALLGGTWMVTLDYARTISTDVLDLIPVDERAPELTLVRSLASQAEARTVLIELTVGDGRRAPADAVNRFAAELGREPAYAQVVAMGDNAARDNLGRELFERRFTLLYPLWFHERTAAYTAAGGAPSAFSGWLAKDTAAELNRFLAAPEALAFAEMIPADPLLLMAGAAGRLQDGLALVQPATEPATAAALVWAQLAASPLSEAGQAPAFAALARAASAVRADFPGFAVADTGVNRFAAASRERIEREVIWLNTLSLATVLAVALVFVRRVHRGLHLVPIMVLSVLGAWVGVTLVFERLHIMVFVVGSLLTGVAIDYGFYLFMQRPARPEEDYWEKVRRLAKPLLASCLTTAAGFALLLFSDLPFIRQLGVFVGTGLICALAAAVVYFSTVRNSFLEAREFRGGTEWLAAVRRGPRQLLVAAWLIALPGLALLTWRDDIRDLEIPSPALAGEHARISALFGGPADRTVYLTYGASATEARASLAEFESWLRSAGDSRTRTIGLSAVVPTAAMHAAAIQFARQHPEFADELRTALAVAGFSAGEFAPFFEAYRRHVAAAGADDLEAALDAMQRKLTGPLGMLVHTGRPVSWFVTLATAAPASPPPVGTNTVSAGQLRSLNRLFSRYRQSALGLSLIGLGLVGAGVLLSYGWRDGARIFAVPCGACLGVFGFFGWLGYPLNLFHLLGAFLGVCLTHNYAIFAATSAFRGEPPPVSVRLSALTTAASFGVLALSGIPVVSALGTTVAAMVVAALVGIEFKFLAVLEKRP